MTTKAQQSALDNALVAPENRCVIGKCNMRINPRMKLKEPTYQVVLDTLGLTTCYPAFLITAKVPVIYMHQFWATVNKHNASYRFNIENKRFSINVEVFREIVNICPRIPDQEFDEPPSEEEALSFILELGYSGEIKYITDVIVYHLHQPWRTFASIINKCLCGKIDNKDSKKQNKMFYPRFMKIIIHHFLTKDKSISMRNRTFMNTARDDSLLGTIRFVSRHEDTQVYGALLPKETPSKKKPTKAKKDAPSTKKPATKPKPTKKKASVKADRGKSLNIISEVALSEAAQLKEISGTDKGTGAKPWVPDVPEYDFEIDKESWGNSGEEDNDEDDTEDDKGNDDGDDSDGNDDDENDYDNDDSDHERTESDRDEIPYLNQFNEEHEEEEEKNVDEIIDKEDDVNNANEENKEELDDDQHNVSQKSGFDQEEEDAHVTLTAIHDIQKTEGPMQSSSVSSDSTEKLLNFDNVSPADNEIASLLDTTVRHEEPSGQTSTLFTVPITVIPTTIPPPPCFFNPLPQQATPTPTPTTSEATTPTSFKKSIRVSMSSSNKVGVEKESRDKKETQELLIIEVVKLSLRITSSTTTVSIWESMKVVYSKKRIIAVTSLKIMKWYDYCHLDEIEVRREDQQLYTFKEGDFLQLRLQDIEDSFTFLLFKYRSNLKNRTAYTAYSDPQGVIYKNQNNRNRLMHTDELYKFNNGILKDIRTALHDIATGIRMEYLPKRKWSGLDKRGLML
ncbi:hypothetical protein Tco_0091388 [Tanacetum coccineum]